MKSGELVVRVVGRLWAQEGGIGVRIECTGMVALLFWISDREG